MIRCFWCEADRKFQKAKAEIAKHRTRFENQCRLTVDETVILGQRKAQAILELVHITPKQPEKLYLVPHLENTRFCGREDTLALLHEQLSISAFGNPPEKKPMLSSVVHSMGGVGKTQVALGYTYKYRNSYDYIFWVRGETDPEISDDMQKIAMVLHLGTDGDGTRVLIDKAKRWLENTS